jgi:nicotinamidase-related amidase
MSSSSSSSSSGCTDLLTPDNCAIIFIDHQPMMALGVQSIDRTSLINNTVGLAKAAMAFKVPTILTAVESKSFSGDIWPELREALPNNQIIERSSMNSWEDKGFLEAVKATKRKKLVLCALWTEVCLCFPALEAIKAGYEVYAVEDCSGGVSTMAHAAAMTRMTQAGVRPLTWIQVMLEFQRDWARKETYNDVMEIVLKHGGAYGQCVEYCYTMVHKAPNHTERTKAAASGKKAH